MALPKKSKIIPLGTRQIIVLLEKCTRPGHNYSYAQMYNFMKICLTILIKRMSEPKLDKSIIHQIPRKFMPT